MVEVSKEYCMALWVMNVPEKSCTRVQIAFGSLQEVNLETAQAFTRFPLGACLTASA